MNVLLGTTSEQKRHIVLDFLRTKGIDVDIHSIAVDSGISDQPLDKQTTVMGSKIRAENAIQAYSGDYAYAIGMEGGLELINDLYHLICVVTVIDVQGRNYTGYSDPVSLPIEVSEEVKRGMQFGVSIRAYAKKEYTEVVNELISREKSFKTALEHAFARLEN